MGREVFEGDDVEGVEGDDFAVGVEDSDGSRPDEDPFGVLDGVFAAIGGAHHEGLEAAAGDSLLDALDVHGRSITGAARARKRFGERAKPIMLRMKWRCLGD